MDGSLSRQIPSQVVVLAEDERHQRFMRYYLQRLGFRQHALRFMALPAGRGCGEQWVREQYAEAVTAYRTRSTHAKSALVVVLDADNSAVEKRVEQLKMELIQADLNPRTANEKIVHLIPRRNIETWVLSLTGSDVDEQADYKQENGIDSKLHEAAAAFWDLARSHAVPPNNGLPSLLKAIHELRRLE